MAIDRKRLELLFKINPNAEVIRGDNVLFINTGAEKTIVNVRASQLDLMVKDLNIPHLRELKKKPSSVGYNIRRDIDLSAIGKTPEVKTPSPQNPRRAKDNKISKQVLTYPELTGTKINTIVNDFFASYYNPSSRIHNKPIEAAFKIYASGKQVPIDNKDLNGNVSILKQVKKTHAGLKKHSRTEASVTAGVKKILKAKVSIGPDAPSSTKVAMTQKVIDDRSKYTMFTNKIVGEQDAIKIGTTMQQHFGVDKPIAVVTPKGVVNIIPKGDKVSVNGFEHKASVVGDYDTLHAYREINMQRPRSSVASSEKYYASVQQRVEPEAIQTIMTHAKKSMVNMTPEAAKKLLETTTVRDVKEVDKYLSKRNKDLEAYTLNDDLPLSKVLPQKEYDEVLSGAYGYSENRAKKKHAAQYKRVAALGKSLGIPLESIDRDLDVLTPAFKGGTDAQGEMKARAKHAKILNQMENTFTQSLKLDPTGSRNMSMAKLNGGVSVNYRNIVKALKTGKSGVENLKRSKLTTTALSNPMLNLEGNIQSQHVTGIVSAMFDDVLGGNKTPYSIEGLTELGKLMSKSDLKSIKKRFIRMGRAYLPKGPKDDAYYNTKLQIEDFMYDTVDKFGGLNTIEEVVRNIKTDSTVKRKDLEIAAKAFTSGDGGGGDDYDMQRMADVKGDLDDIRSEQIKTLHKDPDAVFDTPDQTVMSAHERAGLLAKADPTNKGFSVDGIDLTEVKQKLDLWKKRKENGGISIANYDEMVRTASSLGYTGERGSTNPKKLMDFMEDRYQKVFSDTYPGMKYENGNVNIGLTKSLLYDLGRQNAGSAERVGAKNLNVVKYMNDNKADWSHLLESYHGRDIGDTKLVFGNQERSQHLKENIIANLSKVPEINQEKLSLLGGIYGNNKIHSNREEQAYKSIQNNLVYHEVLGKNVLSTKFDANRLLDQLTEPYNLKPQVGKPGDAYWGKKDFVSESKQYDEYYDPAKRKIVRDPILTKARNNQALNYLSDIGKLKEFQTMGGIDAPSINDLHSLTNKSLAYSKQFVDRQVGLLTGSGDKSHQVRAEIQSKLNSKIYQYRDIIFDSMEKKDFQTARSYMSALQDVTGTFKGDVNKTNVGFAQEVIADTDKAMNKKMTSSARSYLSEQANKAAQNYGAELVYGEEGITGVQREVDKIAANKIKAELLHYDKVGYKPAGGTIADYSAKFNANKDPQIQASKDAIAILDSMTNKSKEKVNQGASRPTVTNFNKEPEPIKPARVKKEDVPQTKNLGLFAGNIIRPWEGKGEKPLKEWKQIPDDHKIWGQIAQDNFPYDKRIRKWNSENIWEKARVAKARWKFPKRFSRGGKIPGKGVRDEVPALLTKGEVVVDRKTSENLGIHSQDDYARFKTAVSAGKIGKFATGGFIGKDFKFSDNMPAGSNIVNIVNNKNPIYNIGDQPFRYETREYDPSRNFRGGKADFGLQEYNRVAKNITIDLAANKAYVTMKSSDTGIANALETAKNIDVPSNTLNSAKSNFANQIIKEKIGDFSSKEIEQLKNLGVKNSLEKPSNLSGKTLSKITKTDKIAVADTFEQLKQLGLTDVNRVEAGFGKAVAELRKSTNKVKGKTKKGKTKFEQAIREVTQDADILADIFDLDKSTFKGLKSMSNVQVSKKLRGAFKDFDYEKANTKTSNKTLTELQHMGNALTSLDNVFKDEAFKSKDVRNERSGIQSVRRKVGRSEQLRESAGSRVSEFGALTMQNAAFGMSYALIGGVQQGLASTVGFVAQFDDAMKNLQAITSDTTDGLAVMGDAVKQVSTETKFSALEIADAATILGQAGFSAIDISKSLDGVVQLATATGSKLEDATQVLTSTLTIWDKSLTDSKKYANEFTAAINESKLDIESLAGAIQYTGNIAASAGISSTDVLTSTGLLKDAGIKRASTLGTGQRLLYGDFAAPSKKFIKSLASAGITLENFQQAFDQEGILGAMRLMKESGYGLAQASRGMEVREKAIYTAMSNQLDKFSGFRESITGTNAAYIANKVQMEGMGNTFKNMLNSWQINMNDSLESSKGPINSLFDALTIEVDKRKPSANIGVKGYSLEDRFAPTPEGNNAIAGIAAAVGIGLGASWAKPYLNKQFNSFVDSNGFLSRHKGVGTLSKATGVGGANILQKGLAGNLNYAPLKGAGIGAIGGVLGGIAAEDGSKVAGTVSGVVDAMAFVAGNSLVNKLGTMKDANNRPLVKSSGFSGGLNKFATAMTLMQIDNNLIGPARERGEGLGVAGTVAEGALAGGMLASSSANPFVIAGGAIAGGIAGLIAGISSEVEAPTIGLSKALSALTNDLKATASETVAISKTAESLRELSNFALRPGPKADETEKISKFRLNVKEGQRLNEQVQSLEAVLQSYNPTQYNNKGEVTGGFNGFNFGIGLAGTPLESANGAVDSKGNPLASVVDGVFKIQEFSAEGVKITSDIVNFEGTAADALASSMQSASRAAYQAQAAPGGSFEKMFKSLEGRDTEALGDKLIDAKDTEDMSAIVDQELLKPIRDLIKQAPEVATTYVDDLKAYVNNAFDLKQTALRKNSDLLSNTRYKKDSAQNENERLAALASIDSLISIGGQNAKTSDQLEALSVAQIKKLQKDTNKIDGNDISLQEAADAYSKTREGKITREAWVNRVKESSGVTSLLNKRAEGKNKLDDIDREVVKLARKTSIFAAAAISKSVLEVGPTMTLAGIEFSKGLQATMEPLTKDLLQSISVYGDIRRADDDAVNKGKGRASAFNANKFNLEVNKGKGTKIDPDNLKIETDGFVDVTNASGGAIKNAGNKILGAYKKVEAWSGEFTESLLSFANIEELDNATGDLGMHKAYANLTRQLEKVGIKDVASFNTLRQGPLPRAELAGKTNEELLSLFTNDKRLEFDNKRASAIASMDLKQLHAEQVQVKNFEFNRDQILKGGVQQKEKLARNLDFNRDSLAINYSRRVRDIGIQTDRREIDARLANVRNIEDINTQHTQTLQALERNKNRAKRDIGINRQISLDKIALNRDRANEDLHKKAVRAYENLDINFQRQSEDLATKYDRGMRDINKNTTRSYEDLNIKYSRGLLDISINTQRAFEDLQLKGERAYEDLATKATRGFEDIAIAQSRGIEDIYRKEEIAKEDIAISFSRGLQDIAIKNLRGLQDIATDELRNIAKITLKEQRNTEDLYTSLARSAEDLNISQDNILSDIDLKALRNIEDAMTNFQDNLTAMAVSFADTIDALERSRQDTIDAFDRSLTKPTNVTLDSEALITIADQFGNVGLALDAHKAALTANTTAVKQNSALQKTQEDIVQEAYIDAYKKVGGEVYNDDGTVNESFTTAYNDSLANNSEGLIDTVLANALAAAYAGTSFDITSALTSADYIAGAVAAPSPGVTMDSAVIGSGYTTDELIAALYDVKSGEVRVTTEAGVILEAQGGMEGALFDLESAMIGIDIKLREAGFAFAASTEAAAVALSNTLRDIEIARLRDIEDSVTAFDRALDSMSLALERGLEDIALSTARALEDVKIGVAYAVADLELASMRALEDLRLSAARSYDDLARRTALAIEELYINLGRAGDDLALSLARGAEDIETSLKRGAQDIEINASRALQDLNLAIVRGAEDIALAHERAVEDLQQAMKDAAVDLVKDNDRAAADLAKSLTEGAQDIQDSTRRAMEDLTTSVANALEAVDRTFGDRVVEAGIKFEQNIVAADLVLKRSLENIATANANALTDARTANSDALNDLYRNYHEQLAEIDIAVGIALEKLSDGFNHATEMMILQRQQGIETLDAQLTQSILDMYNSSATWAKNTTEAMKAGFATMAWDTTVLMTNLQTQINASWDKLAIVADPIIQQVATAFKIAVNGTAMKTAAAVVGDGVVAALDTSFRNVNVKTATTIETIGKELGVVFEEKYLTTLKLETAKVTAAMTTVKATTDKMATDLAPGMTQAATAITTSNEALQLSYGSLAETSETIYDSTVPMAKAAVVTAATAKVMAPTGPALEDAATTTLDGAIQFNNAALQVGGAFRNIINSTATGMLGLATILPQLANAIALSSARAIATINAATTAAGGTTTNYDGYTPTTEEDQSAGYYSQGGLIPGYGGGDTFPAMLEPGEVVLKKEVVKQFGASKFLDLNNGVGSIESVQTQTMAGLPSSQGNAISVQMNVQAGTGIETLEQNMEMIADGVRKVFEEYS